MTLKYAEVHITIVHCTYSKQRLLCTTLLLPLLQFSDIINFVLLLVVNYTLTYGNTTTEIEAVVSGSRNTA